MARPYFSRRGDSLSTWSLTPNVPGRLEALYHLQGSSVIILPGDKPKTKLPQIPAQIFLGL